MGSLYDMLLNTQIIGGGGGSKIEIEPLYATANGQYTASEGKAFSPVDVDVPLPTGTMLITNNGIHNVTNYASADVQVPTSSTSKLPDIINGTVTSLTASDLTGVTSAREYAFSYLSKLTSCELPEGLTIINESAFYNCRNMTTIILPSTTSRIFPGAFGSCYSLASFTCKAVTPPVLVSSGSLSGIPSTCIFYVPAGSVNTYKSASNWSARADHIQAIP